MNMKKLISALLITVTAMASQAKDQFAGFYEGTLMGDPIHHYPLGMDRDIYAEVFHGPDGYRIKILSGIMSRSDEHMIIDGLQPSGNKIEFKGEGYDGYFKAEGTLTGKSIQATGMIGDNPVSFELTRMKIKPPTMGQRPPKGAKVLFDGKNTSAWALNDGGGEINWEVKENAMTVQTQGRNAEGNPMNSSIHTKDTFKGPLKMHIEFKIEEMPGAWRQGRGNSGIFFGPYEVQVLDSFGFQGLWDECGSLYRQVPPQVNACLEPDAWQTYDITYIPAEVKDGKQVKPALFTIYHNGVRIHNESEVWFCTSWAVKDRPNFTPPEEIGFELQDHGNRVSFRNIWVEQLKDKKSKRGK